MSKIEIKLRPMSEAPKDREIFAVLLKTDHHGGAIPGVLDHGNYHPIQWKDYKWIEGFRPHWGMRWSDEFRPSINCYGGWFDPNDIHGDVGHPLPPSALSEDGK